MSKKMKKLLVIALSALLVVGLAAVIVITASPNPALSIPTYTIDYDATTAQRQITVRVHLPADSSYLISGARFKVGYDPTIMTCNVNDITEDSWNTGGTVGAAIASINEHLNEITFVLAKTTNISYTTTRDHTSWLVEFPLTVASNAPAGEYPLTLSFVTGTYVGEMVNATGGNVATDLINGKLVINPIPVTYTASITGLTGGNAVYGTTLGASAVAITDTRSGVTKIYTESEVDHFTYQWKRGGVAIPEATNATYSPTVADILASDGSGNVLSVTIGTNGNFSSTPASSSAVKAVRAPYSGTIPAPVMASRTTDSITVTLDSLTVADSVCQFSKDGGANWQDSTTFTGLSNSTTYTFCARAKKTDTHEASPVSAASQSIKVQLTVTGTLAVSNTTPKFGDTLTAVTSGLNADFTAHGLSDATYTWYCGSVASENVVGTGASYTISALNIGQTITLGISANDDYTNNLWGYIGAVYSTATSSVVKAANTATPTAPSINSNTNVNVGGLVLNVLATQEYKITQAGSTVSDWASYNGSTVQFTTSNTAWLKPATDYVIQTRFATTTTHNTGTETSSTPVTSAKWLLSNSGLSVSPESWVFGTEETATGTTDLLAAQSSLIYQWYRDTTPISGANTNKYTPVAADIGKTLKIILTVGGSYEWNSSLNREKQGVVSKAAGPSAPFAPTILETTYNTIKISTQAGYQYKLDNGSWGDKVTTAGNFTFTGLSPFTNYSIYARIAATDTNLESASSSAAPAKTLKQPLSGSVSISVTGGGDAEWGKTLTANTGTVNPSSAVSYLVYNWYSGDNLVQSGSGSSYVMAESDLGKSVYLSLGVQNDCAYTIGTSLNSSMVTVLRKTISGTASITGLAVDGAEWGKQLTAVINGVTPGAAQTNVTYNWLVSGSDKGVDKYAPSDDGPTYTPKAADVGRTLTLTLGGSGSYRGTVSTTTTIVKQTLTAKPTVSGSPTIGHTINALLNAIPANAQTDIHYQWFRSATETGTGTLITGATNPTYTVVSADIGNWLYVAVTVDSGNATYRGSTRSLAVEGGKEIITASLGISGDAKYGKELTITIGSLTPSAATYDVVWYRDGVQIKRGAGTTEANKKYTLVKDDIGTVITATIIGTGDYTGTPTAAATAMVTKADGPAKPAAPTAVSNSYDTISVSGLAGYAYKRNDSNWFPARPSDGTFNFTGLSPNTKYSVYCYIPETDTHFESAISDATEVTTQKQPITGSVSIIGIMTYGQELTANINSILPAGAQSGLTYAWYRGNSAATATESIGTTTSTLTLGASDVGKYIKVIVTGNGDYTGTLSATSSAAVAKANAAAPGTPALNTKSDNLIIINSVVTNQYAISQTLGGALSWTDGKNEFLEFGGLLPNKLYYIYARVKETGTHNASDACATPLSVTTNKQAIGGAVTITGNAIYSEVLTAVITAVTPVNAQNYLTYQWYRVDDAISTAISGATSQNYTIGASDVGLKIKVRALAANTSDYTSGVESSDTEIIEKKDISGSVGMTGSAYFGDTLSAYIFNVAPAEAQGTLKYQWQRYYDAGAGIPGADAKSSSEWHNIPGATNSTYTVTGADIGTSGDTPIKLRVIVFGDDVNYTNFLYSGSVEPGKKVVTGTISITGTVRYGSTVTASDGVIPSAANAEMSYRWFIDGTPVTGRTDSTFDIDNPEWIGKTLTVEKYVSNPDSFNTGSVASAGIVIGKTLNPGTTVPVQVLSFDKTSITIRVTPGQIYSIDGGATWTGPGFNGVFSGLTPGYTYTIITRIPGSETVDDSATLAFSQQTQPDAINVSYKFYNGITGTVIVPSTVEIGTKATVRIIAPDGYRLTEIFDSMPGGVTLTPVGNDTFTFIAGQKDVWLFIVFTSNAWTGGTTTSSVTSSAVSSVSSTVTSKSSSVASSAAQTSSQTSSQTSNTGSDTDAPNMGLSGMSGNTVGLLIALFGALGIVYIVIQKRRIKG